MKAKLMNLKDNQNLIDLLNKLNIEIEYLDDYKDLGMLVLCDFDETSVDFLLKSLRDNGIRIPLKAIETNDNKRWSSHYLYDQLLEEYLYYLNRR